MVFQNIIIFIICIIIVNNNDTTETITTTTTSKTIPILITVTILMKIITVGLITKPYKDNKNNRNKHL